MNDFQQATNRLKLPAILDTKAAAPLTQAFLSHRGGDLHVDAADVQRLGAQCLQVLLAARAAWAVDGRNLLVENMSTECRAALGLCGVAPEALVYHKELVS
jgi:chemotaxis protein CheX